MTKYTLIIPLVACSSWVKHLGKSSTTSVSSPLFVTLKHLQQKVNTSNAFNYEKTAEDYHQFFCMSFHLQIFDTLLHICKYDFLDCWCKSVYKLQELLGIRQCLKFQICDIMHWSNSHIWPRLLCRREQFKYTGNLQSKIKDNCLEWPPCTK